MKVKYQDECLLASGVVPGIERSGLKPWPVSLLSQPRDRPLNCESRTKYTLGQLSMKRFPSKEHYSTS